MQLSLTSCWCLNIYLYIGASDSVQVSEATYGYLKLLVVISDPMKSRAICKFLKQYMTVSNCMRATELLEGFQTADALSSMNCGVFTPCKNC
jgi:hypothetical protein